MDPETGKIGPEGLAKFLSDLEVRWISTDFLIIAWKFKCQQWFEYKPTMPGEFGRADFYGGMLDFYCHSVEFLKAKMDNLKYRIRDPEKFEELYQFTFHYATGDSKTPGQEVN